MTDPTSPPSNDPQSGGLSFDKPSAPPQYSAPPPPQMPPPQMPPPQMPPMPPPGQAYGAAPPPAPGYGYGQGGPGMAPPGMFYDQASGLTLPNGTQLAGVGRRIGAYFLAIPLAIVTLGIGYVIWGLILWGKGTSPALKVLGMRVWKPTTNSTATWGTMFVRDFVGQGLLSIVPFLNLISFIIFLTNNQHKAIHDNVGGTVVLHDPNKVLG
ncbi:MAG TPA: RDD family protein [Jatrophihabitantaceae bacterium]